MHHNKNPSTTRLYSPKSRRRRRPPPSPPPLAGICSGQLFEEFPSVLISSGLLVQADKGTLLPVVDLIRRNLPPPTVKSQSPCDSGWSQAPRRQQGNNQRTPYEWFVDLFYCIERFPALILNFRCAARRRDPDPPPFSRQNQHNETTQLRAYHPAQD
ncbi:hypothetical protein F511_33461 [Dorcoceras hygrometricum]|uniref:Uncharacterized protein n=1 Tax=Dorcoceras hygrometricum TaxID=472368 RepID=A0A2Z7CLF6_9LAMI|nr:hypothetical protein F511_33461 [Dorcoceras hygrometricum]